MNASGDQISGRTGATVLGTETHCNLLRALDAPGDQLSVVRGGERLPVPGYIPHLLELLGHPPYIPPTHWDDFDMPLDQPAKDAGGLQALRQALAAASPSSRFIVLDHNPTFSP